MFLNSVLVLSASGSIVVYLTIFATLYLGVFDLYRRIERHNLTSNIDVECNDD